MDSDLQDRVLRTFHYALKAEGLLFLGSSEGVSGHANLFKPQDKAAHIFQRRDADAAFPAMPMPSQAPTNPDRVAGAVRGLGDRVDRGVRAALAKHSPVFLVVDRQSNIVRYSGGEAARYLEPSAGIASLSLQTNLRKSLRVVVRAALQSAAKTGEGVVVDHVSLLVEGQHRLLSVIVEPVEGAREGESLFVVAFQDVRISAPETLQAAHGSVRNPEAVAAEHELNTTRGQLQATIGDLETANEEMKSTAEEYQSINEELQSTNEELQTSKEEMQSINEELQTVNAEMTAKNDLLSNLNSDLQNLLNSTQIATIFLDKDLRIKNFTPGMADIFSVRDSDRGRPLTEIVSLLAYDELRHDVDGVLRDLIVVERELELHDRGASFVMRIRPYQTVERVIDGVVITFVDVTARKMAEQAQRVSERRFAAIVDQVAVGITETDITGQFLLTNTAFDRMAARSSDDLKRLRRLELIDPQDGEAVAARFGQAVSDGVPFQIEYRLRRRDGTTLWVHDNVSVLSSAEGQVSRVISVTLDIEQRKRAEEQAGLLLGELDHRVKNILAIVSSIVTQTLKANTSPKLFAETIRGRITAITRAHSVLTDRGVASAGTLRDLINIELDPYRVQSLVVDGPNVALTPKAGLSIAMAIHELASNAAKYGSLSIPEGRLAVSWTVTGGSEPRLQLIWAESGGPHVAGPPAERGFGTALIERAMRYEWSAQINRSFAASGVVCSIDLPLTSDVGELLPSERAGD